VLEQPFRALHFVHDGPPDFAHEGRAFCQKLCADYSIELEVVSIEGKSLVKRGDLSWEAACRHLRYKALTQRAGPFLTAHTADDQAETLIMRLLGGSGLAGLGGIHPRRADGVVRPLLGFERSELRLYMRENGFEWLEDPTNQDGNDRAVVRHQILPVLLAHNPALLSTLGRTAKRLRQDEDFLRGATHRWMTENGTAAGDSWPLAALQDLPPALLARFIKTVGKVVSGPAHRPRASLVEECVRLVKNGRNGAHVPFPGGWSLHILGSHVWVCPFLSPETWSAEPMQAPDVCPGLSVSSEPMSGWEAWNAPEGSVLRSRRPGDEFRGKSLKKLLAQTGHPPWVRNRWPLLVHGKQVLAVYGMKAADSVKRGANLWLNFRPERLRAGVTPADA
jgi:tRNA(Ile)-lysidine synthase